MTPRISKTLFVLAVVLAVTHSATAAVSKDPLVGLWVSEQRLGPEVRGQLDVRRQGDTWSARIAGFQAAVRKTGDSLRFELPDHRGSFRGTLIDGQRAIRGFWIQPKGEPIGAEQPFATPMTLKPAGPSSWSGIVVPLDETFTLYLKVERDSTGGLVGAFRNPEYNSRGRAPQFRVTREEDSVWFEARPSPNRPPIRLGAVLDQSGGRLRIHWPDLGRAVDLERRDPTRAAAFFPSPPGKTAYLYHPPAATGDGWETARARDVGLNEQKLSQLVQKLCDTDPAARTPALIHSLLIAHRGKLVLEEYFFGYDRDRRHDLRSAGKTFASVLLGVAMRRGDPIAPETPVYSLFGGVEAFTNPDPRKASITVADLLTHSSGLACDDNNDDSPGNEYTMQVQKEQKDWSRYTLDLPLVHDPGIRYAYCSGGINLAGATIAKATKTWLPALFDKTVARPLDFGPYSWNLMPNEEGYLGGGTYLRPRDLLKVGQLYLDGGTWRGRRIVDSSWVARSTTGQFEVSLASTGLDSSQFVQVYNKGKDGYAWHPGALHVGDRTLREYEANGNGGQILMVVPELDLAVVFTAGNYNQGIWWLLRDEIMTQEIVPAVEW